MPTSTTVAPQATVSLDNRGADNNQATLAVPDPGHKPYLTIQAKSAPLGLDLSELWRFRDLIWQLALRDLRLRYKQTALGVVWVVIQPLMAAGIFSFVFGAVAQLPSDGRPYFLFSFIGLLGWNLFAGTLGRLAGCLTGNSHLISKVYFPRLVLPLAVIPCVIIDFSIALGLASMMMPFYGVVPTWGILFLPICIATLVGLSAGIGLIAASLSVSFRDVNHVLPVATQLLLYASPVAYSITAVPENLRAWYYLNPLAALIDAFRWSLLGGNPPSVIGLSIALLSSMLLAVIGLATFRRMEERFADII